MTQLESARKGVGTPEASCVTGLKQTGGGYAGGGVISKPGNSERGRFS